MDVPSPAAGTIRELKVAVGDTVSEGTRPDPRRRRGRRRRRRWRREPKEQVEASDAAPAAEPADPRRPTARRRSRSRSRTSATSPTSRSSRSWSAPATRSPRRTRSITLESDKATMDVPSPAAGTIRELKLSVGDTVSEGDPDPHARGRGRRPANGGAARGRLARGAARAAVGAGAAGRGHRATTTPRSSCSAPGPGGYTAAFRAADLGLKVILIERYERLGGVCLNVGCIPSKALLHVARVIAEAEEGKGQGISFGKPKIDLDGLRGWKESVVGRLTGGLDGLAKQRKVEVVRGVAEFTSPNVLRVEGDDGATTVSFDHCIIAAGSSAVRLPGIPDDPRIIDSTGALELEDIPKRLLVIGGGIIGLEMATVYDALGSEITVVELMDQLIPGADKDLVRPLQKRITGRYEAIQLKTQGRVGRAGRGRPARDVRGRQGARAADVRPRAAGRRPPAERAADRRRGGGRARRRARLHPRRQPDAHERAAHLRDRRHRRRADARPQGDARGEGGGRGAAPGHDASFDARDDPVGRLHRSRGRLDGADRDRGEGARASRSRRRRSRGRRPAARCRSAATRA